MRIARLGEPGREIPIIQHDGRTFDLRPMTADVDGAFLSTGGPQLARTEATSGRLPELTGADHMRIGAPIARPGKIVCIGQNYLDHVRETKAAIPTEPVVFLKDPWTLAGPFDEVHIPPGSSKTDWEAELGVVIGKPARYLTTPDDSAAHIAGYAISHDVSEREYQLERGGQWDKGKSCETFNPFGPVLVPADEVTDPQALDIRLWVNDEQRQCSTTANMIFAVDYLVWYLSQFMVLRPGDVVNSGTPAGVALGLPDQPYLQPKDVVELEIEGLGRARQTFIQAEPD